MTVQKLVNRAEHFCRPWILGLRFAVQDHHSIKHGFSISTHETALFSVDAYLETHMVGGLEYVITAMLYIQSVLHCLPIVQFVNIRFCWVHILSAPVPAACFSPSTS